MSPPRVLFLDHVGSLGGAELSLLDVAAHFRATSRVVLFEDGPFREALEAKGVAVDIVPLPAMVRSVTRGGGGLRDLLAAPYVLAHAVRVARMARAFDVIYANSQKAAVVGAAAGVLARRPLVWHLRDLMTASHFSRSKRRIAAGVGRLAARVIANSEATREAFVEIGGRRGRAFTVYNGIAPRPFEADRCRTARALRQTWGVGDAPLVGAFSRLTPWKGQDVLIEALPRLPGVHALIVGGALFHDDEAFARGLSRQAARLGVSERVHFLGFRRDVPDVLAAVDVVVHTSREPEPFGRVIVEGMLAGRPVVATEGGGASEILTDGRTGRLVSPSAPAALAEAVGGLLDSPAEAEALAEAGRREARERFSLHAMTAAVERHVRAVAEARAPSRLARLRRTTPTA